MTKDDRRGFDDERCNYARFSSTMSAVTTHDFRSLHYLIALGGVAAVTVAVFFGVAFLWLGPPHPAAPLGDPLPPRQALEADEVPPSETNDTARGSSLVNPGDEAAPSPKPAPAPNREALALRSAPAERALGTPAHAKRARAGRHAQNRMTISRLPQREGKQLTLGSVPTTGRGWTARWRADAGAGPNPGGGFYDAPNINVGRINPR
jgi:hypothetical protein